MDKTRVEELQVRRLLADIFTETEDVECYMICHTDKIAEENWPDDPNSLTSYQRKLFAKDIENAEVLTGWAEKIADDIDCPPANSHIYACDACYGMLDTFVCIFLWNKTEEGQRYGRESKHWHWHDIVSRGVPLDEANFLEKGDTDWVAIGQRPPLPKTHPDWHRRCPKPLTGYYCTEVH